MARLYPIDPDNLFEPPPHLERLEELRQSAEDQQFLAELNAHLVPSAPSEALANGEANGAEAAMYAALAKLGQATGEVQGTMETRCTDSKEADEAYRALEDIFRSAFGAREGFKRAQDAWWDQSR